MLSRNYNVKSERFLWEVSEKKPTLKFLVYHWQPILTVLLKWWMYNHPYNDTMVHAHQKSQFPHPSSSLYTVKKKKKTPSTAEREIPSLEYWTTAVSLWGLWPRRESSVPFLHSDLIARGSMEADSPRQWFAGLSKAEVSSCVLLHLWTRWMRSHRILRIEWQARSLEISCNTKLNNHSNTNGIQKSFLCSF